MSRIDFTDDRSSPASTSRQAAEFNNHRNQGNVLFVGNLPFQTPWQNIKDQFRRAGKVRYTDLIADRGGRPKGSALVTMYNSEGARRAIKMFNETEFEGRRLIVRLFDEGPRPQLVQREMMPQYNRRPTTNINGNNNNNLHHNNNMGCNMMHHHPAQQQSHHHMQQRDMRSPTTISSEVPMMCRSPAASRCRKSTASSLCPTCLLIARRRRCVRHSCRLVRWNVRRSLWAAAARAVGWALS